MKSATSQDARPATWLTSALGISVGLLIYIGAFKGTVALSAFPIDPTILLAAITFVLSLLIALNDRLKALPTSWPLLALWSILTLGIPFAGTTSYAQQKVLLLFTLCAGIAVVSCVMSGRKEFLTALLWTQVAAGGLMALLLFYRSGPDPDGRLLLEGSNSIGAARVVGAAVVILFIFSLRSKRRLLIHGLAIVGLSTILIGIGSRGPLLFSVISSVIAARISSFSKSSRSILPLSWILLLGGIGYYLTARFEARQLPVARLLSPLTGNLSADESISARLSLIRASLSLLIQNPLGVGWGNFASSARADGLPVSLRHAYPHNVFLEVGVEAGFVALLMFAFVTVAALRGLHRSSASAAWSAALALGIYSLGNALVSGDVTSNRPMWCILGLGIGCWVRRAWTSHPDVVTGPTVSPIEGSVDPKSGTPGVSGHQLNEDGSIDPVQPVRSRRGRTGRDVRHRGGSKW